MKIYIIDDSMSDALLTRSVLEKYNKNFEFIIENDPIVAKQLISTKNLDINLILLDLNMPKFDGIQMLEYMSEKNINIPVIVCSNFINQYENEINKSKVLQTMDKKEFPNCKTSDMIDIFMKLNAVKSCMILSDKLKNLKYKNNKRVEFYDKINSLKKELKNYV